MGDHIMKILKKKKKEKVLIKPYADSDGRKKTTALKITNAREEKGW